MISSTNSNQTHPSHIPTDLIFDFDMYVLPSKFGDDVHRFWKTVQDSYPPIFWTPAHGGHWVATRGEDIKLMLEKYEQFSNNECFIPKGVMPRIIPSTLDPPEHTPFRGLIMPAFFPKALAEIEIKAREVAIEIIEKLRPKGHCEFVSEFAAEMPIIAFLMMVGLPLEDRKMLREWVSWTMPLTNPKAKEGWKSITDYILGWIEKRRINPGNDLISAIVQGTINGNRIADDEVVSICQTVLGGGLDTVVTMTSFIGRHLAQHPEDQIAIRNQPGMARDSVEEFLRRYGITNIAREVKSNLVYKGVSMAQGDMVVLPTSLYGLDERIHSDPMRLDLSREQRRHMAFGSGVHTCVGSMLARRELAIFLEEWLTRMPEFRIKSGTAPVVTTGLVNSVLEMHFEWNV